MNYAKVWQRFGAALVDFCVLLPFQVLMMWIGSQSKLAVFMFVIPIVGFLWTWSELIVMLFNQRRRALHDFIAGTVVIADQKVQNAQTHGA